MTLIDSQRLVFIAGGTSGETANNADHDATQKLLAPGPAADLPRIAPPFRPWPPTPGVD